MHSSIAIVDRSGWDQTFVDSGGGNPLCSSSASAVRTDTDVDSVSLATCNLLGGRTCRSVVDDVNQPPQSTLSSMRSVDHHRVHELVIMEQLHRSIRTSTTPTSVVNCTDSSSNSTVPTSLSTRNCDVLQRSHLLPPCVDTNTDTSPGHGVLHQSHSASMLCPGETSSSPGLLSDPFSSGPVSPMVLSDASSFGPSDFHSYENAPNSKSRTFSVAPGQFSTTSVPASTCSVSVDAAANSAFDFSWQSSNWIPATALDCAGGVGSVRGVPRHSSSAVSDFVGSSTAGSPTPFLNINSSIEVCRSSSSPFGRSGLNSGSGSGGSQSDSGCSDGGGDSAGDGQFRYSGGPSPIVDDFRSAAVDVVSRQRNGIVQPLPVRDMPAPPTLPLLYSRIVSFLPTWDAERLELAYSRLAMSGFYYGRMTIDEAADRLRKTAVGTFLVRDSSDDRFVFSISVQTCRGTTSIRVAFRSGLFRLDCNPEQEHLMPTFDCVLRLLRHYVRLCRRPANPTSVASGATKASYVLLETSGRRDTPVLLREPLHARVTSLAHACRRTIHAALSSHNPNGGNTESDRAVLVDRLQLMPTLKRYLKDYPYDL